MVAIIGGGIAGNALAGALARHGERVTLYEQQPAGPSGGAFLFIDGRGHTALRGLGVDENELEAASFPVTALRYTSSTGRRSTMSRGHRFWTRKNLMRILTDFVDSSGAELRYDHPVTGIDLTPGHRSLHRDTDITAVADDDLIIAADGVDSVVRAALEPDRAPEYAGDLMLYGETTSPTDLDTEPQVLHFFAEIGAAGTPAATFGHLWRPGHNAMWFLHIARDPLLGTDDLGMQPATEWTAAVLRATPSIQPLVTCLLDRTESVHVSHGRNVSLRDAAEPEPPVILIGDADHAITPAAGVGARDALEDAHAVYDALRTGTCPAAAMTRRRTRILHDRELALRGRAGADR